MLETGILPALMAKRADHNHTLIRRSSASRVKHKERVLRSKQLAGRSGSRCAGNDELVRGKAWSLIGLEHAIPECVLLGEREVGLHFCRVHILELGVGWRAVDRSGHANGRNLIGPIHFAAMVHGHKGAMFMA